MSNQIEEIQKLYAKKKTYKVPKEKIEGGEQISVVITPLSLENIEVLDMKEDAPLSDLSKRMSKMVSLSLEITEDEAKKISFEFLEDLMSVIMDANNFKEADMKKIGIKDFIKKKQEQIKEQEKEKDEKPDRNP